jgi:hypothetical protein
MMSSKSMAAEAAAAAATPVGPDGQPRVNVLRAYEDAVAAHRKATREHARLKTELDTWRAHSKVRSAGEALDVTKLRKAKESRAEQALEAQRSLRDAETTDETSETLEALCLFGLSLRSANEEQRVPPRLLEELVIGGDSQLREAHTWRVPPPQMAGQAELWAAGRDQLRGLVEARSTAEAELQRSAREAMKKEGACAPSVELCRLLDVVAATGGLPLYAGGVLHEFGLLQAA